MNIIENIKQTLIVNSSVIFRLIVCYALTISPLAVFNNALAETDTSKTAVDETEIPKKEKESWYEGTWLDGSWIPQSVQIHGFLSQGFNYTTANNFLGYSEDRVNTDYREIGINGSWRVIPELQLSMQILYRDAGLTDEAGVRIDYGYADYSYYSTESTLLGIKGGRIPTPLGFYNETRDILSSRPSIILPQSIYLDRNRNIAYSADGGYFYGEHRTEYGDVLLDIGGLVPRFEDPDAKNGIAGSLPGKFEGTASWVGRLAYEWQSGRVRLQVSYADVYAQYKPEPDTFNLDPGKLRLNPLIFSAQYNGENWSLTGEYELRRLRLNDFGLFPNQDTTSQAYYIQGTYKFTPWMEALVRYDNLTVDIDDPDGSNYANATGGPAFSRFAEDWTFGLRFTLYPNLLFSAEYHRVNGTGWLSSLENPDPSETKQRWDMIMWMISYDF